MDTWYSVQYYSHIGGDTVVEDYSSTKINATVWNEFAI